MEHAENSTIPELHANRYFFDIVGIHDIPGWSNIFIACFYQSRILTKYFRCQAAGRDFSPNVIEYYSENSWYPLEFYGGFYAMALLYCELSLVFGKL